MEETTIIEQEPNKKNIIYWVIVIILLIGGIFLYELFDEKIFKGYNEGYEDGIKFESERTMMHIAQGYVPLRLNNTDVYFSLQKYCETESSAWADKLKENEIQR